jgi:hypothetical protein
MVKGMSRILGVGAAVASLLVLLALVAGCEGKVGPAGEAGTSKGTLSGKVTNSLTGGGVSGVAVAISPAIKDVTIATGDGGSYSAQLPIGVYTVTYTKADFTTATQTASLVAGQTTAADVALKPAKPVAVNAGADVTSKPGAAVSLKAAVNALDGSTVGSYKWTQTSGVKAAVDTDAAATMNVTLGKAEDYKAQFLEGLEILDRAGVLGISPFALEEGEITTFEVTVTTSSGTYKDSVNVMAALPYAVSLGIRDVPIGVPVLLNAKNVASYQWALVGPAGTTATVTDAKTRNPSFTPDVVGKYTLSEKTSGANVDVYAGTWAGGISGLDAKGRPNMAGCTACHDGKVAPDKFTAWKASGHAEIFTQNINDPAGHWAITCAPCHTVGYDTTAKNNGFDEAVAAEGWKVPSHGDLGLYNKMLTSNPKTVALSNIQCENCHGPNDGTGLHPNKIMDSARVSISSDVCGSCHGEPLRHGRFQQWEESGHANYELAIDESGSASCVRCHVGQGFMLWLKQGDLTKSIQGANGNATTAELVAMGISRDTAEPQTCVVCHDPHQQGTVSGEPTTATVRVVDETKLLPAGFQATEVGKGALCMTCHNTRNQLHNVDAPPTSYSGPHYSSQADILMGENAYFVSVGARSPHSYLKDTCVTCHMEASPPPPEYSNAGAGTNHSFKASLTMCAECHSKTLNAEALQAGVEEKIEELAAALGKGLLAKLPASMTVKDYTVHDNAGKSYDVLSNALVLTKDNIVSATAAHIHGQQGFTLKLKNPVSVTFAPTGEAAHTLTLSSLEVRLGDFTTDGTKTVVAMTDNLVKAGWNLGLVEDGSLGVHNPAFTVEVLEASIAALK